MPFDFKHIRINLIYSISLLIYRHLKLPYLVWRVSHKKVINVVFLAMNADMWRYDGIFRRMMNHSSFNPVIVVTPRNNIPWEEQIIEQRKTLDFFKQKAYNVIPGYNEEQNCWFDLDLISPDILFYTQPYEAVINQSFVFRKNLNSLICYTPYSFQLSKVNWNWNNPLQNYCWRQYFVSPYYLNICKEISKIKGSNAIAAGYCLEEELNELSGNIELIDNTWHNDKRKRIIWAPHHSIMPEEMFKVSSFLEICYKMLELRDKYIDKIIFAFKPHPALKSKLYLLWGKESTDAYYDNWAHSENSFFAPGEYKTLFLGSDAMIHCSGSFIVEYHYTGKPVQYVFSKSRNPPDLGEIGDAALNAHYPAHTLEDIDRFIQHVVIDGKDDMKETRMSFAKQFLKSPNGKMFSENVVQDILQSLGKV